MSFDIEVEELNNQINKLDTDILNKIAELIRTSRRIETRRMRTRALILDNIANLAHEHSLNANGIERIFNVIEDLIPKTKMESS
jgi:hypothetical protein